MGDGEKGRERKYGKYVRYIGRLMEIRGIILFLCNQKKNRGRIQNLFWRVLSNFMYLVSEGSITPCSVIWPSYVSRNEPRGNRRKENQDCGPNVAVSWERLYGKHQATLTTWAVRDGNKKKRAEGWVP